jgi:divinyl chlorophyllide a 8-vinyl-reductase
VAGWAVAENRRVFVAGANGYIGRAVVAELVRRGDIVVSFVRPRPLDPAVGAALEGSTLRRGDVTDLESVVRDGVQGEPFDAFVSCLASRSGTESDAWAVDYQGNLNVLRAAEASGARHFVLLSAICLQNPTLAFQRVKLAFETELRSSGLTWSIVRPTAFFKSLAGQVPRVARGKSFILFGPGGGPACKPISERDLARFMADSLDDPDMRDRVLPVGGPGPAVTPRDRGELLFELTGRRRKFRRLPLFLFDAVATPMRLASVAVPVLKEKAELARIGRYYATEPMLLRDPVTGRYEADATPEFGTDTLRDFYRRLLTKGMDGQRMGDQSLF